MSAGQREAFLSAFVVAGHQLWTVGGALRDELLGVPGRDEDFATDATPDQTEAIARGLRRSVQTVGRHFGTIGVRLDGRWSEVTTFRGDAYSDGTRWPDVTFGASIEEDLSRRDFTMNALARNTATGRVLDLFGGAADIEARLIRAVGEPVRRFTEDPLRILRGIRFASEVGFAIEPETREAMRQTAGLLATLSQERVTAELDRLLQGRAVAAGLGALAETGALAVVLPELAPMVGCEQNRFHRFDVWGHTVATVAAIGPSGPEGRVRRWAAFLHDLGKPYVRHTKTNGEWGFFRHETVGADLAEGLLGRLKVAKSETRAVALLVRRHMDRPNLDRRSVRRFMARSEGMWPDLVALKRADNASHTYDDAAYHDALAALAARIAVEDAAALRGESPLSGDDLVRIFERAPGPWIKPVKARLSALVLDGDLAPGDKEAAERVARRMLR